MTRSEGANWQNKVRRRVKCPSKYNKRPSYLDKHSCELAPQIVARKLETAKANGGGVRLPYGTITRVVEEMKPTFPWLTMGMVKSHMKKKNVGVKHSNPNTANEETATCHEDSTLSTLTPESAPTIATADSGSTCPPSDATIGTALGSTAVASSPAPASIAFGRPKGSTQQHLMEITERIRLATADATRKYSAALAHRRIAIEEDKGRHTTALRLPSGTLSAIITASMQKFKLAENLELKIKESTIRSRNKRGNHNPIMPQGTPSPMIQIEPYLVAVITQLARMRSPINCSTGLHLVNSMIEGTKIAKDLADWKFKHNVQT